MPPDDSDARTWRIIHPEALSWRCWDGDYVIFNGQSGLTHALDVTAGAIFELALRGAATPAELQARLAAFLGPGAPPDLRGAVPSTLARLDQLGLAEAVA